MKAEIDFRSFPANSVLRLPPFSSPRVPLAKLFWSAATFRSMIRCIATGSIVDGADVGHLRAALIEMLGAADVRLCGSGSLALEIALRACGVRPGDHVVIPSFCCSALVAPIAALDGVPVLADVGPELNLTAATVEAVLDQKTRAIIVPHMFGNPADIGSIVELARPRGIRVIDDAAQAFGAAIGDRLVGGLGDIGIVSFGREKICSGIGGGAVLIADIGLAAAIDSGGLPAPSALAALRHCLSTLVRHRWRSWTRPLNGALHGAAENDPAALPSHYRRERLANLNAAVAFSLVQSLCANIAARRARVSIYRELLGQDERVQLIPHRQGSACLTQVVRVLRYSRATDFAARIIANLARAGYEIQGSYVPIHLLPVSECCLWDCLPMSEKIWSYLVELPCEPTVELDDTRRIAAIVADSLDD
jgi:dTDP-4-amino-4,6-dideoxygalactose transaminase